MESKVVHFHCTQELGSLLPLAAEGAKAGAVVWLDADSSVEPRYAQLYGSTPLGLEPRVSEQRLICRSCVRGPYVGAGHMKWVEQALTTLRREQARSVQVMGMSAEAQVFSSLGGVGNLKDAQRECLLARCVKKKQDSAVASSDGFRDEEYETFPFWRAPFRMVEHYGCSIAVVLQLRFYREAALLLLAMFAVSIFPMVENASRNAVRNDCRAALREAYEELTSLPAATDRAARCGFAGMHVLPDIPAVPFWLMTAIGTCQEYSNATSLEVSITPKFFEWFDQLAYFEEAPSARMCTGDLFEGSRLASYWFETVNVLLVLAFLLVLRQVIINEARSYDARTITTSDYAVQITGLKQNVNPDDADGKPGLETLLRKDLKELGFADDDIDHIEFGRECRREAECLHRLADLHVDRHELQARRKLHDTLTSSSGDFYSDRDRALAMADWHSSKVAKSITSRVGSLRSNSRSTLASKLKLQTTIMKLTAGADRPTRAASADGDVLKRRFGTLRAAHFGSRPTIAHGPRGSGAKEARVSAVNRAWHDFRIRRQRRREKLIEQGVNEGERQIQMLLLEPHKTTGHAFVVFKKEETRVKFVRLFYRPPVFEAYMARLLMREPRQRGTGFLHTSAETSGVCMVEIAPEPGDVFWENLAVPKSQRRLMQTLNVVLLVLVVATSLFLLTVVMSFKAVAVFNGVNPLLLACLSVIGACISASTNFILEELCTAMSYLERQTTRSKYERSILCAERRELEPQTSRFTPDFSLSSGAALGQHKARPRIRYQHRCRAAFRRLRGGLPLRPVQHRQPARGADGHVRLGLREERKRLSLRPKARQSVVLRAERHRDSRNAHHPRLHGHRRLHCGAAARAAEAAFSRALHHLSAQAQQAVAAARDVHREAPCLHAPHHLDGADLGAGCPVGAPRRCCNARCQLLVAPLRRGALVREAPDDDRGHHRAAARVHWLDGPHRLPRQEARVR